LTTIPTKTLEPGLYPGVTRAQYENWDAARHSLLRHFRKSPLHALTELKTPKKPTAAMEFGTAVHMAILEPKRFANEYVITPSIQGEDGAYHRVDRRTTIGKNMWAEFERSNRGKAWIDRAEYEGIRKMQEKAYAHPIAQILLQGRGPTEVSAYWIDEETGVPCKGRFDKITDALPSDGFLGGPAIVDLKSTESAFTPDFERDIARFAYAQQAAFYVDGAAALSPISRSYILIVMEKEPPYEIVVRQMGEASISKGRDEYRAHLREYAKCRATNEWPGYPQRIEQIDLPAWAFREG
jgi:hypothetical protein